MGGIGNYTDPERESYCRDIRREQTPKEILIDSKPISTPSKRVRNAQKKKSLKKD